MNKDCRLTFVVGISGVGKTTIIRRFIKENTDYFHIEASTLIKQRINAKTSDQIRVLPKEKILANQSILVEELSRYKEKYSQIILDGHLLINNSKELVPIPLNIVEQIAPQNIILIQGNPREIFSHRINNTYKNGSNQTVAEIEQVQNYLKYITVKYCKELCIKFDILDFSEYKRFESLLVQNG